jgi:cell division protein FtsL
MRLPDARWLDRLVRGRAWIAIIALALIGLVFMQVTMLGMNTGIGQAVEEAGRLERQNAALRQQVAQLASEERIQREAEAMGLVMPAAGDVRYLRSHGAEADARRAARVMRAPGGTAQQAAAAAGAGGAAAAGGAAPAQGATSSGTNGGAAGAGGQAQQAPAASGDATSAGTGSSTAAAGASSAAADGAPAAADAGSAQPQADSGTGAVAAPGGGQ